MSRMMLMYARKCTYGTLLNIRELKAVMPSIREGSIKWRSTATATSKVFHADPRPTSEIPGPKRWPLIGSMNYILNHKEYNLSRLYKVWEACIKAFGPIFRLDVPGSPPTIFIREPEDIDHLLQSTSENHNKP